MATPERIITQTENGNHGSEFFESFHRLLDETVPGYYLARGIDFNELPEAEKERLTYDFIHMMERSERRYYFQQRLQTGLETRPSGRIDINLRNNVAVKIRGENIQISLGPTRERMLAFLVALTEEKIYRGLVPMITRKELTSVVDIYDKEQLYNHLFKPLTEAGIFKVESFEGYRLSVDPEVLWKILKGNEFDYEVETEEPKSWLEKRYPSTFVVGPHQQKMLKAICFQARASLSGGDLLDLKRIGEQTKLSLGQIYDNLRELEETSIILRPKVGDQYRMADVVDIKFLEEIVKRQEAPIIITVNPSEAYAAKLSVARQEQINFPEIPWNSEEGFEKLPINRKLTLLDKVLTTSLEPKVYETAGKRYAVRFPVIDNEDEKRVFNILQYLGIGPKELEFLSSTGTETLAAAVRKLEEKIRNKQTFPISYGLLVEQIKVKILSLVFGENITGNDRNFWTFAEVIQTLDSQLLLSEAA